MAERDEIEVIDEPAIDQPEIAAAVESPEAAQAAPPEQTVQPWYEKLGGDYSGLSEDAALERLRHEHADIERLRHEHADIERLRQEHAGFQQLLWQRQQAEQRAAAPPPAVEKPKWQAPEFEPAWLDMVTRDATGNLIAKPGAMPDIPAKIMAWAKHKEDVANRLARDPDGFFAERFESSLQDKIQGLIESKVAEYHRATAVNNWENQNRDILYDQESLQRGVVAFSPAGLRIMQHVQNAVRMGVGDHLQALNYGLERFHYDLLMSGQLNPAAGQAQAAPTPQQAQARKKEEFLRNGARRTPSRSGAIPNSETNGAPRPRFDFKADALAGLEAAGIGRHDTVN